MTYAIEQIPNELEYLKYFRKMALEAFEQLGLDSEEPYIMNMWTDETGECVPMGYGYDD